MLAGKIRDFEQRAVSIAQAVTIIPSDMLLSIHTRRMFYLGVQRHGA